MRRKIFKNNLLIGILVMVLCAVLFVAALFQHYEAQTFERLESELGYMAHGMELSGETYLDTLSAGDRVTWIDADGDVLYDSEADPAEMGNHLDREEIQKALADGMGQSARWSETLLEYNLYCALHLSDGTVLRVSCTQSSVVALLLELVLPILGILLAAAILCVVLSYRLARHIVDPINTVDLDHPVVDEIYAELRPLVAHIREQNRTISAQMDELMRRQREFSALTDNMCEGFLLLDDQQNVLSGNSAAFGVLGETHSLADLRRDPAFSPVLAAAEQALSGTRSEAIRELGGRSWQIIANPIAVGGRTAGAAVLLMDVTEREQRERLRREFSANVSHELKTPLTSISGFAELMVEGLVSPEKTAEFAGDIYRESQRLIRLVEDIIRLSRLDEDAALETESVDLWELCREELDDLSSVAEGQNVTLSLVGESVRVEGVRSLLHDMMANLCENAVKYNRPGGAVTAEVGLADGHPFFRVSDTGIGIPYADQGRVFERFYRVDKSHSKEVGGTGLGLSIVKHAAQYHNANLSLTSVPGEGTTITVMF